MTSKTIFPRVVPTKRRTVERRIDGAGFSGVIFLPEKKKQEPFTFALFVTAYSAGTHTHTPGPFERTPNTKRVLPFRCALVAGGPVFATGCFFSFFHILRPRVDLILFFRLFALLSQFHRPTL